MDARRIGFGDAARPAGDDDAADGAELLGRGVDRQHVALDAHFSHAPCEQVTVLPARVQNRDPLHGEIIKGLIGLLRRLRAQAYLPFRKAFIRACASAETRRSAMAAAQRRVASSGGTPRCGG